MGRILGDGQGSSWLVLLYEYVKEGERRTTLAFALLLLVYTRRHYVGRGLVSKHITLSIHEPVPLKRLLRLEVTCTTTKLSYFVHIERGHMHSWSTDAWHMVSGMYNISEVAV